MRTFSSIDQRRMYDDLAWTWPIINPPQEHVRETEEYVRLIKENAQIPVRSVVNLGCGGGHNDFTLKKHFKLTGVDLSEVMLRMARELNPEVNYFSGDMRSVRLGQSFDAVAVFNAISYMRTSDSLRAAFQTAYGHLRPGGIFIAEIEVTKENFNQNNTRCSVHVQNDIEITLIENHYDPNPADCWYEANYIYLIRRSGELTIETDCHLRGLFPVSTWQSQLKEVGFEIRQPQPAVQTQEGSELSTIIGIKPI